jgi:acyl-coenzyme A synthetase/AMP-(fatty) acid ligase
VAFNTINHNLYFITIGITVNDEKIFANVKSEVRKFVGPVASFNHVVIMPKLPKTRSGKIARKTIAAGKSFQVKENTINFCWVQLFHSFQNM